MAVSPRELHRVVPTVIIYNTEGKYLLVKRSVKLPVFPGKWHVPGGGISMDDYENLPPVSEENKQWLHVIEDGLKREVREEVGIEIGVPRYLQNAAFIRPDGIPVIVLVYYAPYGSGEIIKTDEAEEAAWVTAEEVKDYDVLGDLVREIGMVDKILKLRV